MAMAKRDSAYHSLSLMVAAMLRKNPELSSTQVFRRLKQRGAKPQIHDVRRLWGDWHKKSHNKEIVSRYRRGY